MNPDLEFAASVLGAGPLETFRRVTLPLARRGLLAGVVLTFARAAGEFGATIMIAGNIPGRTQTMPLAILMALETDVRAAVALSLVLAAAALLLLIAVRAAPGLWPAIRGGSIGAQPAGRG